MQGRNKFFQSFGSLKRVLQVIHTSTGVENFSVWFTTKLLNLMLSNLRINVHVYFMIFVFS